jgi:cytochrome c
LQLWSFACMPLSQSLQVPDKARPTGSQQAGFSQFKSTKRMKILSTSILFVGIVSAAVFLSQCDQVSADNKSVQKDTVSIAFAGFGTQVKWGEHLVTVSACHDCHTPKKMTDHGPDIDSSLLLSGHPSQSDAPEVNRPELESKGVVATTDLTSWVGPWGISYTANLTSDGTGIGNWKEEQFIYAIRNGIMKGLAGSRPMLPPMPWQMYRNMTDDELKAIFAYLKTTKPVHNIVPQPRPPVSAEKIRN